MPIYAQKKIENLTPLQAFKRGYMTANEYEVSKRWMETKNEPYHSLVYVDGNYTGVATVKSKLIEIVDKFKL